MSQKYAQLLELANEVERFPLGNCGPSDDPDMQMAYLYGFRDLAKRFVAVANRFGDSTLSDLLSGANTSPEVITEAYVLRADLFCAIDYLKSTSGRSQASPSLGMKKIQRQEVIKQIANVLRATMKTTDINVFLGGFGVEHESLDIVPSKSLYVQNLLSRVSDPIVIDIAREIDVPVPNTTFSTTVGLDQYLKSDGYQAASHDFDRALGYVDSDPEQALGSASSTLESICKSILGGLQEQYPKDESLQPLLKAVFDKMSLSPEGHADNDIKRVLGGLMNSAIGVGVLRTKYSAFHGKSGEQKRKRLTGRHARLAVNSCATVGLFLIETYKERFQAS